MPPFLGPRALECWTRYPVKTSTSSFLRSGIEITTSRSQLLKALITPGFRFSNSPARATFSLTSANGLWTLDSLMEEKVRVGPKLRKVEMVIFG